MPNMILVGGINCNVRNPLADVRHFFLDVYWHLIKKKHCHLLTMAACSMIEKSLDEIIKAVYFFQDLEEWVSSQHGFIVFTMGSMVSDLPEDITSVFLDAFRQIPQKVQKHIRPSKPKLQAEMFTLTGDLEVHWQGSWEYPQQREDDEMGSSKRSTGWAHPEPGPTRTLGQSLTMFSVIVSTPRSSSFHHSCWLTRRVWGSVSWSSHVDGADQWRPTWQRTEDSSQRSRSHIRYHLYEHRKPPAGTEWAHQQHQVRTVLCDNCTFLWTMFSSQLWLECFSSFHRFVCSGTKRTSRSCQLFITTGRLTHSICQCTGQNMWWNIKEQSTSGLLSMTSTGSSTSVWM